jgi:hypothetical protein
VRDFFGRMRFEIGGDLSCAEPVQHPIEQLGQSWSSIEGHLTRSDFVRTMLDVIL